jgi:hypothetical protein
MNKVFERRYRIILLKLKKAIDVENVWINKVWNRNGELYDKNLLLMMM